MMIDVNGHIDLLPEPHSTSASIIVAGDLCPSGQSEALLAGGKSDILFSEIAPVLQAADLAIVNLECPLTDVSAPIAKVGPHLKARPACARGIRSAGFQVVSLANNHILDMGQAGLTDTIQACADAGLRSVGAGTDLDHASQPLLLDIQGVRVAVLAFAEHEFSAATPGAGGAWPLDLISNYSEIIRAKEAADFVLVILHGGNEYCELPSPNLVRTCRYFADLGAGAIVCNHVHVPGGIEVYKGVPIVYSSGNFLFQGGSEIDGWHKGYLTKIGIARGSAATLDVIAYWQSQGGAGVTLMSPDDRRRFLDHVVDISNTIADASLLREKWNRFVGSKKEQYFASLLNLSKAERRLFHLGIWPFWRMRRSQVVRLLNLLSCEAHHEAIVALLSAEALPPAARMSLLTEKEAAVK